MFFAPMAPTDFAGGPIHMVLDFGPAFSRIGWLAVLVLGVLGLMVIASVIRSALAARRARRPRPAPVAQPTHAHGRFSDAA